MNPFIVRTHRQLVDEGVPTSTIDARCTAGRYHRVLPRTYVLGEPSKLALCHAVIEWQPDARLTHRTAGWLYGWLPEPGIVEATVPESLRANPPKWLRLYRRNLDPQLFADVCALPAVTPEQALLDCAAVLPVEQATQLIDEQLMRTVDRESLLLCARPCPDAAGTLSWNTSCALLR
jgi:hypothetical protein